MKITFEEIRIRRVVMGVIITLWESDIWRYGSYEVQTIGLDGIPEDF